MHRAHGARRPGEHGEPLAGPDLVVDVGVGAHPLDDDARDAHRHRPRAEPAVPAFRAQPVGAGDDLGAVGDRPPPGAAHVVAVGRVDRVEEAPPPVLLDALPRDRAQRRGIVHGAAVGLADPHRGAGRLDQPLVAGQGPLPLRGQGVDLAAGAGGGGDVDDDETDADDLPVRRADGIGVEPPLLQRAPAVPEPAAHGNVEPGPAVGEHLAQPGGDLGADRSVHRLQRPAEAFLDGAAVGVEDRPVDPAVAQFGVEERQAHRSGLPQSVEQGERLVARAGVVDLLQHPDQQRALGVGQRLGAEVQRGVGSAHRRGCGRGRGVRRAARRGCAGRSGCRAAVRRDRRGRRGRGPSR